jgi:hypothetical protein
MSEENSGERMVCHGEIPEPRWKVELRGCCGCNLFLLVLFGILSLVLVGCFWSSDQTGLGTTLIFSSFTLLVYTFTFTLQNGSRVGQGGNEVTRWGSDRCGRVAFILHLICTGVAVYFTVETVKSSGYTNMVILSIFAEAALLLEISLVFVMPRVWKPV